jgi:hypothetical protein
VELDDVNLALGLLGSAPDPADPACGAACRADIDGNGLVGMDDVLAILAGLDGASPQAARAASAAAQPSADINGDGFVGLDDAVLTLGLLGAEADASNPACGSACRADLNADGAVRLDDVLEILAAMAAASAPAVDPAADLTGDGFVGLDDALEALGQLGGAPGPGPDTCGIANPCD